MTTSEDRRKSTRKVFIFVDNCFFNGKSYYVQEEEGRKDELRRGKKAAVNKQQDLVDLVGNH